MRILRVANIPDNRTGGMSRYIHFVSDELRAAGHTVDHLFEDGLRTHGGGGPLARFVAPVRAAREVLSRTRRGQWYDVVEMHEPLAAPYAAAREWSRALPPLLVSVYALEARSHEARLGYDRAKGQPVSVRSRVGPLSIVWQANFALRRADHVCVETTADAAYLTRRLGVPRRRVTVQQGGVHPRFFADAPGPRAGILFVGTWLRRKGILDLVPALTAVLDLHPGLPVTLAGCGAPAGRVLADFPERVRPFIRVLPSITDDAVLAALYREHAVFAFPSTFEGLPLALLEAAASGLVIVTTGVCGMADTITDGANGLLVPVGDVPALTAVLDRVVADPGLADRLGRAARESVRGYTWARSAAQFQAAAEAAAGRGGERETP
ncbi:MAG: hypothetical protein JWO38_5369 [Gemmataceae bacterium]|nr:hypothetical protein [Gemmataceae bacterium]